MNQNVPLENVPPHAVAQHPELSVFINCPYDEEYRPRFDALVFCIVCCGFLPRSALEYSVARTRIARIAAAIFSSKYSIHDLSRCQGEGEHLLARFNMPLELGFSIACQLHPAAEDVAHDWMVLVPEGHLHDRFISDLRGFDPEMYDGSVEHLIRKVTAWLAIRPRAIRGINSNMIIQALPAFRAEKARLTEEWGEDIPWHDLFLAARRSAPIHE